MKIVAAATVLGMIATAVQPTLAQSTDAMSPLPPWAQLSACGILGFLNWWTIAKTIPNISQKHNDGMNSVANEVKGLRDDINENMKQQLQCFRDQ